MSACRRRSSGMVDDAYCCHGPTVCAFTMNADMDLSSIHSQTEVPRSLLDVLSRDGLALPRFGWRGDDPQATRPRLELSTFSCSSAILELRPMTTRRNCEVGKRLGALDSWPRNMDQPQLKARTPPIGFLHARGSTHCGSEGAIVELQSFIGAESV
jgi:hypothetical protein